MWRLLIMTWVLLWGIPLNTWGDDLTLPAPVVPPAEVVTGSREWSLPEVVEQCLARDPGLQAARAAVARQRHLVYQATRRQNPAIGYAAAEVGQEGQAGQQGVYLQQTLRVPSKRHLDGTIREREVSIASRQLALQEYVSIAVARLTFVEVAVGLRRVALLERLQASLEGAIKGIRSQVDGGEVPRSALLQAQIEARRNHIGLTRARASYRAACQQLAGLLKQPRFDDQVDTKLLDTTTAPPEYDSAWAMLESSSPEILIAAMQHNRAGWVVRRQQVEPISDVQTQWTLQQDAATNFTVAGIQVSFEVPIYDKNRGAIHSARAENRRTHHQVESVRRALRLRLAQTLGRYQQAWQQFQAMQGDLQSLAKENLTVVESDFWVGDATYLELLNAQRSFIAVSLDTLDAQRELARESARLETLLVPVP